MNSSILVIGATGLLGSEVTRQLVAKGLRVRAGVRHPAQYQAPSPRVETIRFDFADPASFAPALAEVEKLFLIALPLDPEAPAVLAPVIREAKQAGVRQIVFTSAFGVDHNEEAPLRKVERLLETSGIAHTILRPNFFMDNFSRGFIAPMIHGGGGIFVAAEDAKTSFIAVQDIAAVAVAVLTGDGHVGKAYNLTGPAALRHDEVAGIISQVSGRKISYQPISEEAMRQGAIDNGLPEPNTDYLSGLYQVTRVGYMAELTLDVEGVLGRAPTSFAEFARQNHSAWKS